ncbi:MAG TPA: RdgB/HAM1 family non-canonical purine NTP pyrophosphatase [Flavobacteriales bacterium]|nr:RdgB/HAM1 family non-canonical purine NTP pyrophosphatase [Flavobacteriales bacterium]
MDRIVLCTGNPGKVVELQALLPAGMDLVGLRELGLPDDLPETCPTLEGNALQKARYVFERTGLPSVADDTGLEVDALGGAPGVRSARYAGEAKDPQANMAKLLSELQDRLVRTAQFRTVITLVSPEGEWTFEGVVRGHIAATPRGTGGFGYDPVFIPEGEEVTFAEMPLDRKNTMSHRARAVQALLRHLGQVR